VSRNLNVGLGLNFVPGLQEGLVADRGSEMIHEIGIACAKCRTSDPNANLLGDGKLATRLPNCPRCGGDGWLYRDATVVAGLATAIRQQNNVVDAGVIKPGDMQFSIGPGFFTVERTGAADRRVSQNDKFTQTWSAALDEGQTFIRGAASLGENLRLQPAHHPAEDRLWYQPAHALWCEDENGTEYFEGSDFLLGPGRVIKWVGNQPTIGGKYVLHYTAFFEWLVWAPPQERVDRDNKDLGPLIFLRKRHVAYVNDSPFLTSADRVPLNKRIAV
jgi:hypothetical protein